MQITGKTIFVAHVRANGDPNHPVVERFDNAYNAIGFNRCKALLSDSDVIAAFYNENENNAKAMATDKAIKAFAKANSAPTISGNLIWFVKTKETIRDSEVIHAFQFNNEHDARCAVGVLANTGCAGFLAMSRDPAGKTGKVLQQWSADSKYAHLSETISHGAYRDHVWRVFGTKEECEKMVEETNAQIRCWADVHAKLVQIVGSLWACEKTDPYKD